MRVAPVPPVLTISGKLTFAPADPPRPLATYVVQRVAPGRGNVAADPRRQTQVRLRVIPADPATPLQLTRRARFAAAVAAWQALSAAERSTWNKRANSHRTTGYQLFLSARLRLA